MQRLEFLAHTTRIKIDKTLCRMLFELYFYEEQLARHPLSHPDHAGLSLRPWP